MKVADIVPITRRPAKSCNMSLMQMEAVLGLRFDSNPRLPGPVREGVTDRGRLSCTSMYVHTLS